MPSISDLITKTTDGSRPLATTVTATRAPGVTTLSGSAFTGWENTTTAVHFQTFSVDANDQIVAGSQCDWKGIVSGTTITNLVLKAGTDTGNSIGDIIAPTITAAWGDEMAKGILVEHKANGKHSDITADTVTVTGALTVPDGGINGNELSTTAITLGLAIGTIQQTSITSTVDLTGLSTTVTVPAGGRKVKISWSLGVTGNATGGVFNISVYEGITLIRNFQLASPNGSNSFNFSDFVTITPTPGSHTYKLTGTGVTEAITIENVFTPGELLVEAI